MRIRKQAVDMLSNHIVQAEELDRKGFTNDRDELFNTLVPGIFLFSPFFVFVVLIYLLFTFCSLSCGAAFSRH